MMKKMLLFSAHNVNIWYLLHIILEVIFGWPHCNRNWKLSGNILERTIIHMVGTIFYGYIDCYVHLALYFYSYASSEEQNFKDRCSRLCIQSSAFISLIWTHVKIVVQEKFSSLNLLSVLDPFVLKFSLVPILLNLESDEVIAGKTLCI